MSKTLLPDHPASLWLLCLRHTNRFPDCLRHGNLRQFAACAWSQPCAKSSTEAMVSAGYSVGDRPPADIASTSPPPYPASVLGCLPRCKRRAKNGPDASHVVPSQQLRVLNYVVAGEIPKQSCKS